MAVQPDDVYRRPWAWRRVSRDEACAICGSMRVVVICRPTGPAHDVEWFTPNSTYHAAWRPQLRDSLRYYVLLEEPKVDSAIGNSEEIPEQQAPPPPDAVPVREGRDQPQEEDEESLSPDADTVRIAAALTKAAENGTPFCEECERARQNAA